MDLTGAFLAKPIAYKANGTDKINLYVLLKPAIQGKNKKAPKYKYFTFSSWIYLGKS